MASYIRKIRKADKEEWGFIIGNCETKFKGKMSHRIDKKIEYFSNDTIDILLQNEDGTFLEKITGKDRKKYKYHEGAIWQKKLENLDYYKEPL